VSGNAIRSRGAPALSKLPYRTAMNNRMNEDSGATEVHEPLGVLSSDIECLALRFVTAACIPSWPHGSARITATFPQRAAATAVENPPFNISPSEPL